MEAKLLEDKLDKASEWTLKRSEGVDAAWIVYKVKAKIQGIRECYQGGM